MNRAERPRVLVVDDSPSNAQILRHGLDHEFVCETAANAAEALEMIRSNPPDLVLLDILMPGMDGYEVCRRLKDDDATRNIPIIFLTALDDEDDETRGLELGAVDYVTKPFRMPIVQARVRNHVEMKRRRDLLERHALIDCLTGVPNRRNFDDTLSREWRRAMRKQTPLGLIIADIDFFKDYNDLYGHRAGDACLREVAQAMAGALKRPSDMSARYGGEEFAAILPSTDLDGAMVVARSIREAVEGLNLPYAGSAAGPCITVSLGAAAVLPGAGNAQQDLVEAADQALYRAKRAGRNCIETG